MSYRDRIRSMQMQGESKFRNAGGFEGVQYPRGFRSAAGGIQPSASEQLDPNDRTWTVKIVNAATTAVSGVIIFGSVQDLTDANKDSNITITVSESSHLKVKTELLTQAVRILGMKMTVTSATQFSNVVSLYDTKSTGAQELRLFQPLNYRSAQNQLTTQIDAPSFEILLTATTYMSLTVNASETVTFTFTIVEKVLIHNLLRNSPVVAVSNRPAPTGLPQIDMPRGV